MVHISQQRCRRICRADLKLLWMTCAFSCQCWACSKDKQMTINSVCRLQQWSGVFQSIKSAITSTVTWVRSISLSVKRTMMLGKQSLPCCSSWCMHCTFMDGNSATTSSIGSSYQRGDIMLEMGCSGPPCNKQSLESKAPAISIKSDVVCEWVWPLEGHER